MLFLNVSYNDANQKRLIDGSVGTAPGLFERLKTGGNGFGGVFLEQIPPKLKEKFKGLNDRIKSIIEARKNGILIRFKIKTETYAFVIPKSELKNLVMKRIDVDLARLKVLTNGNSIDLLLRYHDARNLMKRLRKVPVLTDKVVWDL